MKIPVVILLLAPYSVSSIIDAYIEIPELCYIYADKSLVLDCDNPDKYYFINDISELSSDSSVKVLNQPSEWQFTSVNDYQLTLVKAYNSTDEGYNIEEKKQNLRNVDDLGKNNWFTTIDAYVPHLYSNFKYYYSNNIVFNVYSYSTDVFFFDSSVTLESSDRLFTFYTNKDQTY